MQPIVALLCAVAAIAIVQAQSTTGQNNMGMMGGQGGTMMGGRTTMSPADMQAMFQQRLQQANLSPQARQAATQINNIMMQSKQQIESLMNQQSSAVQQELQQFMHKGGKKMMKGGWSGSSEGMGGRMGGVNTANWMGSSTTRAMSGL